MSRVRLTFDRRPPPEESDASLLAKRLFAGVERPQPDTVDHVDPLAAFGSEQSERKDQAGHDEPETPLRPAPWVPAPLPVAIERRPFLLRPLVVVPALVLAVAGAVVSVVYFGFLSGRAEPAAAPSPVVTGRAVINSNPPGAQVLIDGEPRGTTPVDVLLPAGVHTLQLQQGAAIRTLPLEVAENQTSAQYIELSGATAGVTDPRLPPAAPPPVARGAVERPSPPVTPPARPSSGQAGARAAEPPARSTPTASRTAAAAAAPGPRAPIAEGVMMINVPFPVDVSESGRPLGRITGGPLRLSSGPHTLDLSNAAYEFRTTLAVNIAAGVTTRTPVTLPSGSVSVNAMPWAEVFIDGRTIGLTPLANVPVPIGSREIVWRHPQLGERRQTVAVTAHAPVRIGIDYTR